MTKRMMTYGVAAMMLMAACKKTDRFNHFTGETEGETEEEEENGFFFGTTDNGLTPEHLSPDECAVCAEWWENPDRIEMDQLCEDAQAPAAAVDACAAECSGAPNPTLWEECMFENCGAQISACTGEAVTPECVPCSAYLASPTPETQENVCAEEQADMWAVYECRQGPCSTSCNGSDPSACQSCMYEVCSGAIEACQS